jgi:hypothetical protein
MKINAAHFAFTAVRKTHLLPDCQRSVSVKRGAYYVQIARFAVSFSAAAARKYQNRSRYRHRGKKFFSAHMPLLIVFSFYLTLAALKL